jgi:hypothetical protein
MHQRQYGECGEKRSPAPAMHGYGVDRCAQLFGAKSRKRRNDQNQCSNRHGTDGKLCGSVVLASVGMPEQGRRNDKQQGGKSEVAQEHEVFAKRGSEFAAARILKSWNGWKKGTIANMQVNDQEDNIRKWLESTPSGPSDMV